MTPATKPAGDPIVYIVDDDESLRSALDSLLRSVGLQVRGYASAAAFLQRPAADVPGCLLLDVRLHGISGLDFQAELARSGETMPVILMTGHGDIPMSVRAMKAGAIDFLTKPFRDQDLLDAVASAHERDRRQLEQRQANSGLYARYAGLTPRETEVMWLAVSGLLNKQIAGELGTSEVTVKIHRGHAMKKMQAKTFADLVRMAQVLELGGLKPSA
ncbi:response regulator transcription factor [Herbaspirillum sp. LeCh32-8]|uniref:response regulator transcription factor n=1 Tax=Herbaspirillum sp. LeCh32-8 TaxID=2821356 RepID=UPI001AE6A043|nr:response regulator transcription factor [Herbaspirillum sp. LeCh32-8]MBP0598043.1 response regulator transcription factor [Herbaspirillum sp. LeCh32-8]